MPPPAALPLNLEEKTPFCGRVWLGRGDASAYSHYVWKVTETVFLGNWEAMLSYVR